MMMVLANACDSFQALPSPGGILDQDPYLLNGVLLVREARDEKYRKDNPAPKKKG
jgi:hypothetical protein